MSPILKRDISDHLHYARRLATAATGHSNPEELVHESSTQKPFRGYASGSSARLGIGIEEEEVLADPDREGWKETVAVLHGERRKGKARGNLDETMVETNDDSDNDVVNEAEGLIRQSTERHRYPPIAEVDNDDETSSDSKFHVQSGGQWKDLRSLLLEVCHVKK